MSLTFGNLTAKQLEMLNNPARILYVGTGTKTGKSAAAHAWIAAGILKGDGCAWAGPWSAQTMKSYRKIRAILEPYIQARFVKANDSQMRMECPATGGFLEPFTGDNPQAIFGDGIRRFVIDEASRQTEDTFTAAMTTTAATKGSIRLMFNVDHGAANWAVSRLLATKAMPIEQREQLGVDYLLFPTLEGGLVDSEEIERARREMPRIMFEALYLAIIPESDLNLFHNLPEIFQGRDAPAGPQPGHRYAAGIDVARKKDYTALTIFDVTYQQVVQCVRFHELAWTLQYAKAKAIYDLWGCRKAWVDATGLGDPVVEELRKVGMSVEPFLFTHKTRNQLIEQGVVACDGKKFTVCRGADPEGILRAELTTGRAEQNRKTGEMQYVFAGEHDDVAISFLLAWHAHLQGGVGPTRIERVADPGRMRIGVM